MTNLFDIPANLPGELIETLLPAENIRIERIVSRGHGLPPDLWYDQDQHEWVLLVRGAARLRFDDGTIELKPGDFINIAAHKRHRVDWTTPAEPTIWLAIHYSEPV
jgi:cupin 2 domain-containing protein